MRFGMIRKEPVTDMGERAGGTGPDGTAIAEAAGLTLRGAARVPAANGRRVPAGSSLNGTENGAENGRPAPGWSRLRLVAQDMRHGARARVRLISCRPEDPASRSFDQLRTRLLHALRDHGWHRIAVTAPARGCGTTFVAANLAISLSRLSNVRTLLMDLNLAQPGLARAFDIGNVGALDPVLTGAQAPDTHLFRIGANLALGLNDRPVGGGAALFQHPVTRDILDGMQASLRPDVTLYDLPPMLGRDDVEAFLPQVDGVLLVTDGTRTVGRQIAECERLLDGRTPLLGVVLNRAETRKSR